MVNYQNGKIYKLLSNESDMFYIGSTTQPLYKRLRNHLDDIDREHSKTHVDMKKHTNIKIELIELFPCNTKEELTAREGYYIREYKDTLLNIRIDSRTMKQWRIDNRDKIKEYRLSHKDQAHQQYQNNREKYLANAKIRQEQNKEKIALYKREWYLKKKSML